MQILAVAEDPALAAALRGFFSSRRHRVAIVPDERGALDQSRSVLGPRVVLFELAVLAPTSPLLGRIREAETVTPTWLIGLTDRPEPALLRPYLEAGLDDYLALPLDLEALRLRMAVAERTLALRCQAAEDRRRLEKRQQRREDVLDALPVGLVEVDAGGRVVRVNDRFCRLTGFTAAELRGGRPEETFLGAEARRAFPEGGLLELAADEPLVADVRLEMASGRRLSVELTARPRIDSDGRTIGAYLIVEDRSRQQSAEEALRHREEYFRVLWESTSDLITILDLEGRILHQSESSERILGWRAEDLVGTEFVRFLHEEDRDAFAAVFEQVLESPELTPSVQVRFPHHHGEWRTLGSVCQNLFDNPVVGGIIVTSRDVTERIRIETALKREQARFRQLFRKSPAGIVMLDAEGRVVEANRAFLDLFQFELDEVLGRPLGGLVVPPDLTEEDREIADGVRAGRSLEIETRRLRSDGTAVEVSYLAYPLEIGDRRAGAFGIFSDITERKNAERRLFHDATHDALTGLPNRSLLGERLERCLRRAQRRADYRFALVFVDLDGFKQVNDTLGHAAGDTLLVEVSRRLRELVRPGDTVARLGGDEFTLILDDVDATADVVAIADRILESLARPFEVEGGEARTSGSLGIAFGSARYPHGDDLLRDADIAMYRAKARGKSCWEIYDDEMHQSAVQRSYFENDLRRAVEREELRLLFQPVLDLTDRRIVGVEGLLRWQHPERGLLPPEEILPVCDDTGLIVPIGRWVMREGCRTFAAWRARGLGSEDLRLGLNLSRRELLDAGFLETLTEILGETGVEPAQLSFEIAEQVVAGSSREDVARILWALHERGFGIEIDDFGSGLSSIGALKKLPVDRLKLDRTFVRHLTENDESVEIARAISALAESLGLAVVAEGIETPGQLAHVRALGFELGQGKLFQEPAPSHRIERLLGRPVAAAGSA